MARGRIARLLEGSAHPGHRPFAARHGIQRRRRRRRGVRRAVGEGKVSPIPSLLMTSAMAEARTVSDPAGNHKLTKSRQRARDDAAAAAILAVAAGTRREGAPTGAYLGTA